MNLYVWEEAGIAIIAESYEAMMSLRKDEENIGLDEPMVFSVSRVVASTALQYGFQDADEPWTG